MQYFKDLFTVQEALTTTLCVDLSMYVLGSDGCLYRGKPKWNEVYPTQAGCSLNEDFVDFSLSAMSLECWPISWLSHCCFQKCGSNSGCRFCMLVLSRLFLSTPTVGGWWSQWWVMAAGYCDPWWRWWSNSLWVTPTRLWLHLFLLCLFWFSWNQHEGYLDSVLVDSPLQSHRYGRMILLVDRYRSCQSLGLW